MGSSFSSWNNIDGAIYTGANGVMEIVWLVTSVVLCIAALVIGARHELDAYRRIEPSDGAEKSNETEA